MEKTLFWIGKDLVLDGFSKAKNRGDLQVPGI